MSTQVKQLHQSQADIDTDYLTDIVIIYKFYNYLNQIQIPPKIVKNIEQLNKTCNYNILIGGVFKVQENFPTNFQWEMQINLLGKWVKILKITQSGICPAPCVLSQCTVVYRIYHVEFYFRFSRLVSFPVSIVVWLSWGEVIKKTSCNILRGEEWGKQILKGRANF